ncbi:MAG: hypothetical protein ACI9TY_001364 [Alphaproteobacteria bacterium]|jgi:hypothetical protein
MTITTHDLWAMIQPYTSTHAIHNAPSDTLMDLVHSRSLVMFLSNEKRKPSIHINMFVHRYMGLNRRLPQHNELISTKEVRELAGSSLAMGHGRKPYHTYLTFFKRFANIRENERPNGHMLPDLKDCLAVPFYSQCLIYIWDHRMVQHYNCKILSASLYKDYTHCLNIVEALRTIEMNPEIKAIVDSIDTFLLQGV